jgi:hypothetical protein
MAYNLISFVQASCIVAKNTPANENTAYNVFVIGGYIAKNGNQRTLKLSLVMKRRE